MCCYVFRVGIGVDSSTLSLRYSPKLAYNQSGIMLNEVFFEKLKECYLANEKDLTSYNVELPVLKEALEAIQNELSVTYELVEPIDRGGASIVVKVKHKKMGIDYALKLPRPRREQMLDTVKQEMQHLVKIRHENIIAIHDLGEVPVSEYSYPYFVMDYIQDAINLRRRLEQLIDQAEHSSAVIGITSWVAQKIYGVARALEFLHQQEIIHFDVKPGNIFIDCNLNDRPILADLGYAKTRTDSDDEVVVGFTLFYVHPDLEQHYLSGSSSNRITKPMSPKNFKYTWDIYALGKSLLELLALIDRAFPDVVGYDITFSYLHLAACRMLDGLNLLEDETRRLRNQQGKEDPASYWETWQRLERREFQEDGIRYTEASQIVHDLEKLYTNSSILQDVPEAEFFFPHRVQVSESSSAPFTQRVKKVVEHPVFSRLSEVPQLGLIKYIYPPATHTRLEHSIGTFRNCCHYVQALYNDPYNPLFKQFVNSNDIKRLLLASLLHDLGQYPFAHELEDISEDFNHRKLTLRFLNNPIVDNEGHTIRDIIENSDWGWGVSLSSVTNILITGSKAELWPMKDLKTRLLSSIIDGPIDADKLDYLIRDSHECRLPYGKLIDYDRLVRNLTTFTVSDRQGHCDLELGIYEKGQSAAESLTFARYLLYQALYWHHSARAIRAMLREAVRAALQNKSRPRKSFADDFATLLGINSNARQVTVNDFLNLVEKWTDESGKEMVTLLRHRRFYKRILTIHEEEGKESTWDKLQRVYARSGFQNKFQQAIIREFSNITSSESRSKVSLLAQERIDHTMEVLQKTNSILVDVPSPSYGAEESLKIIPEPQRLQRNYLSRISTGDRISEVWAQVHHRLMRIAAKGRVFCHPDARDTLMAAFSLEDIKRALDEVIGEYIRVRY